MALKKINYTGSSKVILRLCEMVNQLIDGGGGGSTVTYTQTLSSGTKTGSISIDGVSTDMYAPTQPTNVSDLTNDAGYLTSSDVSAVAMSGSYSDLSNTPTLGTAAAENVGVANGVAELDANGKVPSSQLPSYVDDVIEGYYDSVTDRFYEESTFTTVIPPESGKSWVDIPSNKSYRWTGSVYTRVDEGVQLGETSSTAYRGDRGKTAYDHSQSDHSTITPAFTEASTRANIATGESIATIFGKIKKYFTDLKAVAFSGSYSDLSNTPTIPTVNNGTLTIKQNGTTVGTFSANQSGNIEVDITGGGGTTYTEGDGIDITNDTISVDTTFTEASTRANIASGETFSTILGKIKKFFTDLKDLAFIAKDGSTSKYLRGDGTWQTFPTIPDISTKVSKTGDTMSGILNSSYKSGSWVNSLTKSAVSLEDSDNSFGGWICGPTKNGRIVFSTWQASDDKLYLGYGERGRTTNSYTRSVAWNGATGKWEASITGNCDGNAATATKATKDGDGNTISSTYLKLIQNDSNVLKTIGGAGTNQWYKVATLTIIGAYINYPTVFEVTSRGRVTPSHICITFASTSNLDPNLAGFTTDYDSAWYIKKTATSTWELYVNTGGVWNPCYIHRIFGAVANGSVTIDLTSSALSGAPSGTTQVGFILGASYANDSGKLNGASEDSVGNTVNTIAKRDSDGYVRSYGFRSASNSDKAKINGGGCYIKSYDDSGYTGCFASSFTNMSSKKYKENIKPITEEEAEKLLDVEVVTYDYKEDAGIISGDARLNQRGVIAEQVENIIPSVITYEEEDGKMSPNGVDYSKFVPYLIKMVQIQQEEIDNLKAEISALKQS